jgi:hypothetical protein
VTLVLLVAAEEKVENSLKSLVNRSTMDSSTPFSMISVPILMGIYTVNVNIHHYVAGYLRLAMGKK